MVQATRCSGDGRAAHSEIFRLAPWLLLLTLLVVVSSSVRAEAPKVLSGHEITERNKPGVIKIESSWQTKFAVWDPKIKDVDQLERRIESQVRAGLVPADSNDIKKAMLAEIARHSDQYLTRSSNGFIEEEPLVARGSGFIITPDGYIVTNEHVVSMNEDELIDRAAQRVVEERSDKLIAELFKALDIRPDLQVDSGLLSDLEGAFHRYFLKGGGIEVREYPKDGKPAEVKAILPLFNGTETTVKILQCDVRKEGKETPGKDVAILKVEANNLPTVPVGDDSALSQGDQIYVMGFPGRAEVGGSRAEEIEATLTAGRFSASRLMPGGWKAIQTDAAINPGNSGGPAFNERGEVIGVATFGAGEGTQGLNYLVPVSVVEQFIQELNVKPRDGELSMQYREALASFEAGDYTKARNQFLQIKEESAGFPFVQEYIDRIPKNTGFQYWGTLMWVAVAAVLLAVGGFIMSKRKPQLATAPLVTAAAAGIPAGRAQAPALPATGVQSYGSLQCSAGPLSGQRFPVPKQGLLIGRDSSKCQIVLSEDDVSKEHAWVVPLDGSVVLIDRGSTNGVFLNSMDSPRVSKVPLKNGDKILIGKSAATFTYYSV